MKRNTYKENIRSADLPKDLKPIIKPVRNTRTKIRQLLRSFIPLHSPEDTSENYRQFPN
ncbi:hypothetical protein [Olivibacter jilunii]|uniref:hypothetical protein n=1 Tax=Olivibacter jilunii TaxID=985016 RepID=UPI0013EF52FD|nr:hypothetical protein [Olivibacter jilunii]